MSLIENFRKAEQKGALAIHRGVERAREEWSDVERKLRQRMRVYPQKSRAMAAAVPGSASAQVDEAATSSNEQDTDRKPIVSVYGHDLKED
ncbi:MAG TPA: hypothetical protein VJW55_11745 [Candidatus Angelobacter sp.]|jgi:hypothetical protein|nr:hypothetical protein [Candidatus Angelobacter sp.]